VASIRRRDITVAGASAYGRSRKTRIGCPLYGRLRSHAVTACVVVSALM
jgi:hypothetical protein